MGNKHAKDPLSNTVEEKKEILTTECIIKDIVNEPENKCIRITSYERTKRIYGMYGGMYDNVIYYLPLDHSDYVELYKQIEICHAYTIQYFIKKEKSDSSKCNVIHNIKPIKVHQIKGKIMGFTNIKNIYERWTYKDHMEVLFEERPVKLCNIFITVVIEKKMIQDIELDKEYEMTIELNGDSNRYLIKTINKKIDY
jgi:hypothetical protein